MKLHRFCLRPSFVALCTLACPLAYAQPTLPAPSCPPMTPAPAVIAQLQATADVEALAASGPLPANEAGLQTFLQARKQWTIATSIARVRGDLRRRFGFDPLDAQALSLAGLEPADGIVFVQLRATGAPLLLAKLQDAPRLRQGRMAALAEEEGPGQLTQEMTPGKQPWVLGHRRFGNRLREAGAYALVSLGGEPWALLAGTGNESALARLLEALAQAPAQPQPRLAAEPPAAITVWQRRPLRPEMVGGTTASLQWAGRDALLRVDAGQTSKTAGAAPAQMPPSASPTAPAAALSASPASPYAAALTTDTAPGLLAEVSGAKRLWLSQQLDFARIPQAAGRAVARLGQPALQGLVGAATRDWAQLAGPAFVPLQTLLSQHDGPFWLRATVAEDVREGQPNFHLAVATELRTNPAAATKKLQALIRRTCSTATKSSGTGKTKAAQLSCDGTLPSPRGPATVMRVSGGPPSGSAMQIAIVDRWVLVSSQRTALTGLLAHLPAVNAAAVPAGAAAKSTPSNTASPGSGLSAPVGSDVAGTISFPAASRLAQGALMPRLEGGLAGSALSMLPQLLLAGPMGDALRELAALGTLDWQLCQDGRHAQWVGRLGGDE